MNDSRNERRVETYLSVKPRVVWSATRSEIRASGSSERPAQSPLISSYSDPSPCAAVHRCSGSVGPWDKSDCRTPFEVCLVRRGRLAEEMGGRGCSCFRLITPVLPMRVVLTACETRVRLASCFATVRGGFLFVCGPRLLELESTRSTEGEDGVRNGEKTRLPAEAHRGTRRSRSATLAPGAQTRLRRRRQCRCRSAVVVLLLLLNRQGRREEEEEEGTGGPR